jgi:recombinational DNA repair protein RecR
MTGLMKSTATYIISISARTLVVTTSAKITAFAGTGSYQGIPFVITGSLSAAGKGTFK